MAVVLKTLNLLHGSSCEMFTFCEVLHRSKQETLTNSTIGAVRSGNLFNSTKKNKASKLKRPKGKNH